MSRKSPEEAARRWVPGAGPVVLEPLTAGLVNESWRVRRAGRDYAMRLATGEGRALGLDRAWECRVSRLAGEAGVGPVIRGCEPSEGILVAEWAPGCAWSADQVREPGCIESMAQLLHRVHALPAPLPARCSDPAGWIAFYEAQLRRCGQAEVRLRGAACARLSRLAGQPPSAAVLCHGDLHRENVAVGARAVLLDWEYAHVAEPFWDLAGWIANNDGDARFAHEVLARYLRHAPSPAEAARLADAAWLYDYVGYLWSLVYSCQRSGAPAAAVAVRAERLLHRLSGAGGGRAGQVPAHYPP
jgi:aminoglycoside phosphotransferase (APT) family kinase protein